MSLGTNLQFYRKKINLTQEGLADLMGVSRQTVSKWESDAAFPETDKLVALSEKFGCTIDTLIKGNAEDDFVSDKAGYDSEMNRFTKTICIGTSTILTGLVALIAITGLFGVPADDTVTPVPALCVGLFLLFVAIGAAVFIVGGIRHGDFVKENPYITPFYTEEQKKSFKSRFPVFIAVAVIIVFIGVIGTVVGATLAENALAQEEMFGVLSAAFLILCVDIAAPIFIYAGMQYSKYDIEAYNKENNPEKTKEEKLISTISGCIMLTATIAFLLMGFLGDLWHIGWVVYPVGGILCGIATMIINAKKD